MADLDQRVVTHKLDIIEETRPIKQASGNFQPELKVQIRKEIQKLIDIGFIKPIQHTTWIANPVPFKNKNMDKSSTG